MIKSKCFFCEVCQAHRLHAIKQDRENESKESRLFHVRICTVCDTRTPLALHEQPGLCCPRCLDVRSHTYSTVPDFKSKRLALIGKVPVLQFVPIKRRVRECRNCKHRFRCIELLEAVF